MKSSAVSLTMLGVCMAMTVACNKTNFGSLIVSSKGSSEKITNSDDTNDDDVPVRNDRVCSGHIDDYGLYSGKPEWQISEPHISFLYMERSKKIDSKTDLKSLLSQRAFKTVSFDPTGVRRGHPEYGDFHSSVLRLPGVSEPQIRQWVLKAPEGQELILICHGLSETGAVIKFCDSKVEKKKDVIDIQIRTSFYTHTRLGCGRDEDGFCQMYCEHRCDPLIVDLGQNGLQLQSLSAGVKFDINGIGTPQNTAWTAPNSDDAFVVYDKNQNGIVDDGSELLGPATDFDSDIYIANGFAALSILDANNDGIIDAQDVAYSKLSLWLDRNSNGRTEASELLPLSSRVDSVSLKYSPVITVDRYGNFIWASSNVKLKGLAFNLPLLFDVWFLSK